MIAGISHGGRSEIPPPAGRRATVGLRAGALTGALNGAGSTGVGTNGGGAAGVGTNGGGTAGVGTNVGGATGAGAFGVTVPKSEVAPDVPGCHTGGSTGVHVCWAGSGAGGAAGAGAGGGGAGGGDAGGEGSGGFVLLAAGPAVSNEEVVSGMKGAGAAGASSLAGVGGVVVVAAGAGIS
jgi:hypothetical protein